MRTRTKTTPVGAGAIFLMLVTETSGTDTMILTTKTFAR